MKVFIAIMSLCNKLEQWTVFRVVGHKYIRNNDIPINKRVVQLKKLNIKVQQNETGFHDVVSDLYLKEHEKCCK